MCVSNSAIFIVCGMFLVFDRSGLPILISLAELEIRTKPHEVSMKHGVFVTLLHSEF